VQVVFKRVASCIGDPGVDDKEAFSACAIYTGRLSIVLFGHWWWAQAVFHFVALSSTIR
jgi:hypothetical protein